MPDNMAFHELRGGDIFRAYTFEEAKKLLNGESTEWEYAKTCAQIALTMKANNIGVYDAAYLLGFIDDEDMRLIAQQEDLDDTDIDILTVSEWIAQSIGSF